MPNDMPLSDWLGFLDREYLSTFIKDGGASVKFAVTTEDLKPELRTAIVGRSKELDYIVIELDAAVSRVHRPQDIFFGMASQSTGEYWLAAWYYGWLVTVAIRLTALILMATQTSLRL